MSEEPAAKTLRDISNVIMDSTSVPASSSNLQGSVNNGNVFKRLSISPSKNDTNDINRSSTKVSPPRKPNNRQLTPKRLLSPTILKEYVPKHPQDRLKSKSEELRESCPSTHLVFPTSPTKLSFSTGKRIGGDGSLSKLRSRFSNGLLSPQRLSTNSNGIEEVKGRNLFYKLQALEENSPKGDGKLQLKTTANKSTLYHKNRVSKDQQKKSVKFVLPSDKENTKLDVGFKEIKDLLLQVIDQQQKLESRLTTIEKKLCEEKENEKEKS